MADLDPESARDSVHDTMQVLAATFQSVLGEADDVADPTPRQQIAVE